MIYVVIYLNTGEYEFLGVYNSLDKLKKFLAKREDLEYLMVETTTLNSERTLSKPATEFV